MLAGASLGACASAAGVSLRTSLFMRHRLCEVMARTSLAPRGVAGIHTGYSSTASRSPTLSGNHLLG